jgi:hypothetical protein
VACIGPCYGKEPRLPETCVTLPNDRLRPKRTVHRPPDVKVASTKPCS